MRRAPEHRTGKAEALRFHDLVFDDDLLGAARDDGATLRLTRQERALLGQFVAHPHRLLSREQLLCALVGAPADVSDRNVDFIVNRLRRKLNDTARKPRFISTQYGEGYVWVAEPGPTAPAPLLIVLGPVRGAPEVVALAGAQQLIQRLQAALEQRTSPGRVMTRPQWRGDASEPMCRFSLEISLRLQDNMLQAVLSLRQEPGHVALSVRSVNAMESVGEVEASALATTLMGVIWRRLVVPTDDLTTPPDAPLSVRIHDAAQLLGASDEYWARIAPKLAADRAAAPEDPHTALIWATYLQSRLMRGQAGDPSDPATYAPVEDEIEGLVFSSLPAIRAEPVFVLSAANLLISVHRDYEDLAEGLVRSVLAENPAYAMALPILAQIEAKRGALEQAISLCDDALRLCEPESETEIYLLVIKARNLVADDDRDAAQAAFERIAQIKPLAGRQLGLIFARPGEQYLTADLRRRIDKLTTESARQLIGFQYFVGARRFGIPGHRLTFMSGLMDHLVRRFGPDAVPSVVAEALAADEQLSGGVSRRSADARTDG